MCVCVSLVNIYLNQTNDTHINSLLDHLEESDINLGSVFLKTCKIESGSLIIS